MKGDQCVILLVDDDVDILDSTSAILEAEGFAIETAPTAEEGLRVFKDTQPDLVIVDLMMEEIDSGTTFVTNVRALGSDVPTAHPRDPWTVNGTMQPHGRDSFLRVCTTPRRKAPPSRRGSRSSWTRWETARTAVSTLMA